MGTCGSHKERLNFGVVALARWEIGEGGTYTKRESGYAVVKVQPWLKYNAEGHWYLEQCRALLALHVNWPNEMYAWSASQVLGLDGKECKEAWESIYKLSDAELGEKGISALPTSVRKKYQHGRLLVQKSEEAAARADLTHKRDAAESGATEIVIAGGLPEGVLRQREIDGHAELERVKRYDALAAKRLVMLQRQMDIVPGHRREDFRCAVLALRTVGLGNSYELETEDGVKFTVPAYTAEAYYLSIRELFERFKVKEDGRMGFVDVDGGWLGLSGVGVPQERWLKEAASAVAQRSSGGRAGEIAYKMQMMFNGMGRVGVFGDRPRVRKKKGTLDTTEEEEGKGEVGEADDGDLGAERVQKVGDVAIARSVGQLCGLATAGQEVSCLHREVMDDGVDDVWEERFAEEGDVEEQRKMRANDMKEVEIERMRPRFQVTREGINRVLSTPPVVPKPTKRDGLDPSQQRSEKTVYRWMSKGGRIQSAREDAERPPRILLAGTAGAGKTSSIENALAPLYGFVNVPDGGADPYAVCAWTGVAAVNVGLGARTMSGLLGMKDGWPSNAKMMKLYERFAYAEVFVIDEVGNCEASKFGLASDILDAVMRHVLRLDSRHVFPWGFGGLAVIIAGDFAQLPPINEAEYLLGDPARMSEEAAAGQRLFNKFEDVVKLKRRYRQKLKSDLEIRYADMTVKQRDSAMGPEEYRVLEEIQWEKMDEDRQASFLSADTLWLCAENTAVDLRNAESLVVRAHVEKKTIFVTRATYPTQKGAGKRGMDFKSYARDRLRASVGSNMMLTVNFLWGSDVVPFGLMNGARGKIVGIGEVMPDGEGNGMREMWRAGDEEEMYRADEKGDGRERVIVVEFPSYVGKVFFEGEGREKWVPVGDEVIVYKYDYAVERCSPPLRLCYAVTGHKSQGIGVPRLGVDFTAKSLKPAEIPGWAFVALTRAYSGACVCVVNLPPLGAFVSARQKGLFLWRGYFEDGLEAKHFATYRKEKGLPEMSDEECKEAEIREHLEDYKAKRAEAKAAAEYIEKVMSKERPPLSEKFDVKKWLERQTPEIRAEAERAWSIVFAEEGVSSWETHEEMLRAEVMQQPCPAAWEAVAEFTAMRRQRDNTSSCTLGSKMKRDGFKLPKTYDEDAPQRQAERTQKRNEERKAQSYREVNVRKSAVAIKKGFTPEQVKLIAQKLGGARPATLVEAVRMCVAPSVVAMKQGHDAAIPFDWFEAAASVYLAETGQPPRRVWAADLGMRCRVRVVWKDADNACLWLSVFATYVQAVRRDPELFENCEVALKGKLKGTVQASRKEKVVAKETKYEAITSDVVKEGAFELKEHVCEYLQSAAGMAEYMAFFETSREAAEMCVNSDLSTEEAQMIVYSGIVEKVRDGGMADHVYCTVLARLLRVRIVALRWTAGEQLMGAEQRNVIGSDADGDVGELIVGYTGLHFVPVLDRKLANEAEADRRMFAAGVFVEE